MAENNLKKLQKEKERIEQKERMFRTLAENLPDIISRFDLDFKRIYLNKAFETYTGRKRDKFIGKTDPWVESFKRIIKTGKPITIEAPLITNKGIRIFNTRLVPEFDDKGVMSSILTVGRDITDKVKEEKRKSEFVSIASHELKTPITSLKAFTQIVIRRLGQSGDLTNLKLLKSMEKQVNRLTILVSDLLDVTKIEAGKLALQEIPFNINSLVNEIVDEIRTTMTDVHKILIKGKAVKQIVADRFRVGQVISNLLINAIKYSPSSSRIIITVSSNSNETIVSIQDFGIGIPKSDQEHVFKRFFQAHAPENNEGRFSSMGLGLYISSEIIKRHRGRIWCESIERKGSTFSFSLPC